jgi:hypothetical protein
VSAQLPSDPRAAQLEHIRVLIAEPDEITDWIVDGLLHAGEWSVMAVEPKSGKSTTAYAIGVRIARRELVLGRAEPLR